MNEPNATSRAQIQWTRQVSRTEFAIRAALAIAIAGAGVLIWKISGVLVLVFAGIVLAVAVQSLARFLIRHTRLSMRWAILVVIATLVLLLAGLVMLIGARMDAQFSQLTTTVQSSWASLRAVLVQSPLGRTLLDSARSDSGLSVAHVTQVASGALGGVVDLLVILFTAVFFTVEPGLYRRGVVWLAPARLRADIGGILDRIGSALAQWLRGVLVAMLAIGAMTSLGLWLLGIPLALSLGLLAGVLEFIPYVGPIISAVPAVLVAFSIGPRELLEVVGLYLLIHGIEGYILVPIIQKHVIALPPALGIVAVVIFGVVFGVAGVIFAHPLTVTAMVTVQGVRDWYQAPSARNVSTSQ